VDFPNSYADYDKMTKATVGYPYNSIFKQDDKIPGFLSWSAPTAGMWLPGGFDPVLFATKHLLTVNDTVSTVVGTHTMKFGAYFGQVINKQPSNDPSAGLIQFGTAHPLTSNNILADMVAGIGQDYSENTKAIVRDMGWKEFAFFAQDNWKATRRLTLEYGLRVQHLQPWTARNGLGIATWVPRLYDSAAPSATLPGISWNAKDKSVPLAGWATKALHLAPRFGFAYQLDGQGNTVVRGGIGRFVYHDPQLAAGAMDLPAGLRSVSVNGGYNVRDIQNTQNAGGLVFGGSTVDSADDRQPTTDSWNLTVSRRLPMRSLFEVAYVGNRSRNLINGDALANINKVPIGAMLNDPTGDLNKYRPLTQWQSLSVQSHDLSSNYHALQSSWGKQSGRTNFTFAYTWSRAMGITNGNLNGFDRNAAYGPLSFDRTHVVSATYVLNTPNWIPKDYNALLRGVGNGWVVSGVVQAYSGPNLQQNSNNQNFNLTVPAPGGSGNLNSQYVVGTDAIRLQPRIICNPTANLQEGQFVNAACFAPPIPGSGGRPGINGDTIAPYMRGPAYFNADLSLFKEFSFSESRKIQFRAQAYNFLNHPIRSFIGNQDPNITLNFDAAGKLTNPRFGFADNRVGHRTMMLGVKFFF
ncbi:MAG: carboxypeptidase regulatory-like domain-containing protein, partial [Bryobacteraceae bacterium]|nr:carboxypeptidase regulatory-like domain-containing protein [Bryobacteraceae bacterium]